MSYGGNPEIMDNEKENNKAYKFYTERKKQKFEGWPILWILIAIFLVSAILWYTGLIFDLINWVKH